MKKEFMNTKEVCEWLRISRSTLHREILKGLPHLTIGGKNVFIEKDVWEYFENKKK